MRDIDIRNKLLVNLRTIYANESDTRIIEEFELLNGVVRIDLAAINGSLNGYEIKSDRDNLKRLPLQQKIYSQFFDTVTIITGWPHTANVISKIPSWWGIWNVIKDYDGIKFEIIRNPELNPCVVPQAIVQCLWRDEVLGILKDMGLAKGLLSKPRAILRQKLADEVPVEKLKTLVCRQLKVRHNWRLDPQQRKGDG